MGVSPISPSTTSRLLISPSTLVPFPLHLPQPLSPSCHPVRCVLHNLCHPHVTSPCHPVRYVLHNLCHPHVTSPCHPVRYVLHNLCHPHVTSPCHPVRYVLHNLCHPHVTSPRHPVRCILLHSDCSSAILCELLIHFLPFCIKHV